MTGQANHTMVSDVPISASSASRSKASRAFGGIMPTMTSIRSCRPDQATTPLPRKTQPTIMYNMISSAQ